MKGPVYIGLDPAQGKDQTVVGLVIDGEFQVLGMLPDAMTVQDIEPYTRALISKLPKFTAQLESMIAEIDRIRDGSQQTSGTKA